MHVLKMRLSVSMESGCCFLNYYITPSTVSRMAYPFGEESLKRLVQAYADEGVEVGDDSSKRFFISRESGKYFLDFYLTPLSVSRIVYPFGEESLKKLVQAYISEGVDVVNGNLEDKLFDYLTKK